MDKDGMALKLIKRLNDEGIRANMTVMVTFNQLYLVAKAWTIYVSPFFNRAATLGSPL